MVNAGIGVAFVLFSLGKLQVVPTAAQVGWYVVAVGLGTTVHYSIMFMLATFSFWIVRAHGLIYGYYNLINVSRYPSEVFGGLFRLIFTWLIPVVVVANSPARILARASEQPLGLIAQLLFVSLLAVGLSRWFWTNALRRYSSAST